jgi:iron complex outermembrane receptor protein
VGFHHRLDDAVVRVSAPGRRFRRINRDELRSTGLELLASWRPPGARAGTPLAELSVSGDLLVQRVRAFDQTLAAGLPSERRPEHQPAVRGSGELEFPLPAGVRGLAMVRFTGRQFCVNPDVGRQVALDRQTMVNAVILRDWTLVRAEPGGRRRGLLRTLRAQLGLDNVADAAVFDQCGLPQPGRTLRLGLELR